MIAQQAHLKTFHEPRRPRRDFQQADAGYDGGGRCPSTPNRGYGEEPYHQATTRGYNEAGESQRPGITNEAARGFHARGANGITGEAERCFHTRGANSITEGERCFHASGANGGARVDKSRSYSDAVKATQESVHDLAQEPHERTPEEDSLVGDFGDRFGREDADTNYREGDDVRWSVAC